MSNPQVKRKYPNRINPDKLRRLGEKLHKACEAHGINVGDHDEETWVLIARDVYDLTRNDPPLTEGQVHGLILRETSRNDGEWRTKLQGEGGLCETANWTYRRMRNLIGDWAGCGTIRYEIHGGGKGITFYPGRKA